LPYVFFSQPKMPVGTNLKSPTFEFTNATLLIDRTCLNEKSGKQIVEQQIFNTVLEMIEEADDFILLDFFLWNPWKGVNEESGKLRALSSELAQALISKRRKDPDLPILAITDPINRIYGGQAPIFFDRLAEVGIPVVYTDISRLRKKHIGQ